MRCILLVLCTVAALTGCSHLDQGAPCTEADMDSGVAVVWRPADFGNQDAASIRLCVDGNCKEMASGSPDDPIARVSVRLPQDVGPTTVPVRLRVTSKNDSRVVVEDSRRARLREQHPNGASCAPTAWTATFRADPDKGLTSTKGMTLRGN
jgi:hypothetical protein